jgi:hypothetical protein
VPDDRRGRTGRLRSCGAWRARARGGAVGSFGLGRTGDWAASVAPDSLVRWLLSVISSAPSAAASLARVRTRRTSGGLTRTEPASCTCSARSALPASSAAASLLRANRPETGPCLLVVTSVQSLGKPADIQGEVLRDLLAALLWVGIFVLLIRPERTNSSRGDGRGSRLRSTTSRRWPAPAPARQELARFQRVAVASRLVLGGRPPQAIRS